MYLHSITVAPHDTWIVFAGFAGTQIIYGANYTPPVNTVYADLPNTHHSFTFNCDQFCEDSSGNIVQATTIWSLDSFRDSPDLVFIDSTLHPEFFINGTEKEQVLPFPTYRNMITIVNLTQRLHNVTLFCGQGRRSRDGSWDLRVYSESHMMAWL